MKRLIFPLLLLLAPSVHAFTPESGWWWNPEEDGRGFNIEIQDNVITIATYVYDQQGRPVWYLASGLLEGYGGSGDPEPFVSTHLGRFENGQCIGCEYNGRPDAQPRFAGKIRIDFTSRTTGVITWRDESTTPIQRHNFALGNQNEKMLGEWRMVIDFSSQSEDGFAFWSADALVFDQILKDERSGDPYFDGYRRFSRFHDSNDKDDPGNAAGEFDDGASGNPGIHIIVVHNSTDPDQWWLAYYLDVGTDAFEGIAEVYCEEDCNPTGEGVPVRGWRSASRKFVTDHGQGPSQTGMKSSGRHGDAGGIPVPEGMWAGDTSGRKSVSSMTGDPERAKEAVQAARRLTEKLRSRMKTDRIHKD